MAAIRTATWNVGCLAPIMSNRWENQRYGILERFQSMYIEGERITWKCVLPRQTPLHQPRYRKSMLGILALWIRQESCVPYVFCPCHVVETPDSAVLDDFAFPEPDSTSSILIGSGVPHGGADWQPSCFREIG